MAGTLRLAVGTAAVVASMVLLFTVPREYFAAATFFATGVMLAGAYAVSGTKRPWKVRYGAVATGLGSAALLYMVFYAGAAVVDALHPFGITSASETSIYGLIASPSNPLGAQVALLLFDSAGFESFFRGVLQDKLQKRVGLAAAPAVALLDAGVHLVTLNPLWVGATFVTDLTWGVTYHYGKGLPASFTSHFVWDLVIFIVRPIT